MFDPDGGLICDGPECGNQRSSWGTPALTILAARAAQWHCYEGPVTGGGRRNTQLCPDCVGRQYGVRKVSPEPVVGQLDMFE